MSNNPNDPPVPPPRGVRQIRGPQSALTDFLASHNISANQIRQDANARRAAALAAQQQTAAGGADDASPSAEPDSEPAAPAPRRRNETKAQSNKRKKEEEKAIAKIKASKMFKKRRKDYGSDDEISDEDEAARAIFAESMAPMPDQLDNCEMCGKRFTVTPYSRKGEDGGLLCPTCTRKMEREEGAAKRKRKSAAGRQRRQIQSNLLDGIYPGAKSLITLCIETLVKNVDLASDLGGLPPNMIDKISRLLSKKRLLKSTTLDLFLTQGTDTVTIYEGAYLSSDDYIRIFQVVPSVKHLRIINAVQFKSIVMDHLLATTVQLESLSLYGANLIDDERWSQFLTEKASDLRALQVYYTDGHFGDDTLKTLADNCPELTRLKVSHNQKVTDTGISHIANLSKLKHLTLQIYNTTTSPPYVEIINSIGAGLWTLCLGAVHSIDDTVLEAIHENCLNLDKLRISDNKVLTDQGFADLFTNWKNPPLRYIDFEKCRHIDAAEPRENPDSIGLGSLGFEALISHSGAKLKYLNISACRHISLESFERVFSIDKRYPDLEKLDVGFCQSVNDYVVGCIFRSCPNLKTLVVFGNFGVRDVMVPKGKILIGVPNAMGMQIEGTEDGEGRVV